MTMILGTWTNGGVSVVAHGTITNTAFDVGLCVDIKFVFVFFLGGGGGKKKRPKKKKKKKRMSHGDTVCSESS